MAYENEIRWYVVHTYSGYENKVAENIEKIVENRSLQHLIYETKIPLEIVVDTPEEAEALDGADSREQGGDSDAPAAKKTKKPVEHKLFPSYVLVKMIMNDESWHVIRNVRGVTGFVGPGSRPVPLSDEEVAALGVDVVLKPVNVKVGDNVFVVSGLLAGTSAVVTEVDEATRRIKVNVMFGGRETSVDMDIDEVEIRN